MTSLTKNQLLAMSPADRQLLSDECQRVYRIIQTERIIDDAAKATFFEEFRDGRGRE